MKKIILTTVLSLLLSLRTYSQSNGGMILYWRGTKSSIMIEGGLVLAGVGMIIPNSYMRDPNGNWVPKPFFRQPAKFLPVTLGVGLVFTGYISGLIEDRKKRK